ncbi:MAG: four helix bundle protein [Bdellovibrionales bacterium]|nr:four helix bundle protein [Bdellovibrionales bacterium]
MVKSLKVIQKLEVLLMELLPALRRFPKTERYTLAEKMEKVGLDVVESIYTASYHPQLRNESLNLARTRLHLLGFLLRISRRQGLLSEGLYEIISLKLVEIGKMLTGWEKATR